MTSYLFSPPAVQSLPVRGKSEQFPINRLFFVGRNYHAHAVEMGKPVDKTVERPFYFTKSPSTLVHSGATVAYPPETHNYHHEMELVIAIGNLDSVHDLPGALLLIRRALRDTFSRPCGRREVRA